jgi:hypothetical protein
LRVASEAVHVCVKVVSAAATRATEGCFVEVLRHETGLDDEKLFSRMYELSYRRERAAGKVGLRRLYTIGVGGILEAIELFCFKSVTELVDFFVNGWATFVLGAQQGDRRMQSDKAKHFALESVTNGETVISRLHEWLDSNGRPFVKQAIKKALGDALDVSDLDALQRKVAEVFESMDVDGGGTLDTLEVLEGMAKLGLKMDLSEVEELIAEVDDNGNGALELSEFWQARPPAHTPLPLPRPHSVQCDPLQATCSVQRTWASGSASHSHKTVSLLHGIGRRWSAIASTSSTSPSPSPRSRNRLSAALASV